MILRKISEDASTITLGWDRVEGADGFRFTAEQQPKPSHTWNGERTSVRFAKGSSWYRVEALEVAEEGVWPLTATSWKVLPPTGPLADRNGGSTQDQWRFDYTIGPVLIEKQWVHDYKSYGYGLMQWPAAETPAGVSSAIRDLHISGITRNPPRSSNGTAEAGLWDGQTSLVQRVLLEGSAWMQVWTGARCYRSLFEDIRMRDTRLVGIYPEHNTWDTVFRRFINEESPAQLANTVNVEWWYSGEGSKNLVFDQFDLYVPKGSWAFFVDAGNGGIQIAPSPGSRIWGPGNGVIFPKRVVAGLAPNRVWLDNIDMSQLEGTRYAEHDNAIGTFTQRVAAKTRSLAGLAPKLHPGTVRFEKPLKDRMAEMKELARSA